MKLSQASFRFTVASTVTWPKASWVIGKLQVGTQQPAVDITVDDSGLGSVTAPQWTRPQMSGTWSIIFDLDAIKTNLGKLLDANGWIDPAALLDVEMMLACSVTVY
jgi:hypothetical protein